MLKFLFKYAQRGTMELEVEPLIKTKLLVYSLLTKEKEGTAN